MIVLEVRNVREALPRGVALLLQGGVREESRAGPVLVYPGPVSTVYSHPCERVLLNPVRDANPFFHLAEALWMLAGRRDSAFLDNFVRDFGSRFADDGVVHGAYGYRWRHALGFDQLDVVVQKLRDNPADRQAVIQMWDASKKGLGDGLTVTTLTRGSHDWNKYIQPHLDSASDDLVGTWRDRPCNTQAYLRVRRVNRDLDEGSWNCGPQFLDMMVTCRSNDIIMGAYGANAVHFSVLLEYLAARIGVAPGRYTQVSWNYHAYERDLDLLRERAFKKHEVQNPGVTDGGGYGLNIFLMPGPHEGFRHTRPLVLDPATFDGEVRYLLNLYESLGEGPADQSAHDNIDKLTNPFLSCTAWPMLMAHRCWRLKSGAWRHWLSGATVDPAWRSAGGEWIERRTKHARG